MALNFITILEILHEISFILFGVTCTETDRGAGGGGGEGRCG